MQSLVINTQSAGQVQLSQLRKFVFGYHLTCFFLLIRGVVKCIHMLN